MLSDGKSIRRVAVLGGTRVPFARSYGSYASATNRELLTTVLDGLAARFRLDGECLGEVVAGAVLKHAGDFNLTRESVLDSRLDSRTPAYDMQQACTTGIQTVIAAANKIAVGAVESAVAGGTDTMSDVPMGFSDQLRTALVSARRARTVPARLRALSGLRPRDLAPALVHPDTRTGLSMGEHVALSARAWGIDRTAQDELAVTSHRRLAAAYDSGFMRDLVVPHRGLDRDENLRTDTSVHRLARLRPVFGTGAPGATMTAGNSTALSDGAAVVLLASEGWARRRGLEPLAYLVAFETAAVDFAARPEDPLDGMMMAPARAVPRLLRRVGLGMEDFDFVEVHEAFAAQVLANLAAWEKEGLAPVAPARLNAVGSSLATGHPFAATGARIVATLAKLLAERGGRRGLVSLGAAGGLGVAAILERPL
ncbi:acetyl-CoA C-acetyltransferase [Streptomyces sp. NPDC035033]|uniref:acetyl-CoA C-acetyltransferase n=1 Tax=Streptomyces sp. NPDC035033 TaxID=3155368 RepID=UPI0033FE34FA